MGIMQIAVTKGKGYVEIDTDPLPQHVYEEALRLGLKEMVNRGMSKITVAKLEGEDLAKAQAAAMAKASENVEDIKAGKIKIAGQKTTSGKVSGAVNTEAMRLARNIVKDTLKANGYKISHYKASEISAAAKELIAGDPGILAQAEKNLADRATAPVAIDLKSLVAGMKEDPDLVAKAEKKKAEAKDQLSAKQAGMVKKQAKPQAGAALH